MGKCLSVGTGAILACSAWISPVLSAEPFPDFTFKRVKPPESGTKKLITIQVGEPETSQASESESNLSTSADLNDWFWDAISPELEAAEPGRFQKAVDQLANLPQGQRIATPRLEQFRTAASLYGNDIMLATLGKKVSPALMLAVIGADAENERDALGLMRLPTDVSAQFGVENALDPAENFRAGAAYLDSLLEAFSGDPILALAAYHAGARTIFEHQGVPLQEGPRAFVPKVLSAFQVTRALCLTPPEIFSDGCVFAMKEIP